MKKIEIYGKHNKDRIKKSMDPNTIAIRECMENIPQLSFIEQKTMINQLYLESDFDYKKELLREIDKKIW